VEIELHAFLIAALDTGDWLSSRYSRFTTVMVLTVPIYFRYDKETLNGTWKMQSIYF
jgi:hypothetical protein